MSEEKDQDEFWKAIEGMNEVASNAEEAANSLHDFMLTMWGYMTYVSKRNWQDAMKRRKREMN